jgi:hypothetical protein
MAKDAGSVIGNSEQSAGTAVRNWDQKTRRQWEKALKRFEEWDAI